MSNFDEKVRSLVREGKSREQALDIAFELQRSRKLDVHGLAVGRSGKSRDEAMNKRRDASARRMAAVGKPPIR